LKLRTSFTAPSAIKNEAGKNDSQNAVSRLSAPLGKTPKMTPEICDFLREMEGRKSPFSAIWKFSLNRLNYGNQTIKHTSRKTAIREPGPLHANQHPVVKCVFTRQRKKLCIIS
jgi:hypothetical protein